MIVRFITTGRRRIMIVRIMTGRCKRAKRFVGIRFRASFTFSLDKKLFQYNI